jgi:hypothetical protein
VSVTGIGITDVGNCLEKVRQCLSGGRSGIPEEEAVGSTFRRIEVALVLDLDNKGPLG